MDDLLHPEPPPSRRPQASPTLAAILATILPGLGHLYLGQPRLGAAFALPVLALLVWLVLELTAGAELFAVQLLDPEFALSVLVVILILGAWRASAIVHAFTLVARRAASGPARGVLVVLLASVVGMHGLAGYYAWAFYQAGSEIFEPPPGSPPPVAGATPTPVASGDPGRTPEPGATEEPATPTPRPPTNRITFLLMGVDSNRNRTHALTDTLLVVSVDKVDKTAAMISIPRDIAGFRLYSGGTYNGKINSLLTAARQNPSRFPDGPTETLKRQIGFIVGLHIDYYAQINLEGFEQMVNLVGGVDVVNPRWIRDPNYDWFDGTYGFTLSPGSHHLNGRLALAYARSRMGAGDSDFTRARRQQQIIVALRNKLTTAQALERLPDLLRVASRTIRSDFPSDDIREYVALGREVGDDLIERYVLGPPYARSGTGAGNTYILQLDMERVAQLSIDLFGADSDYYYTGTAGLAP